MLKKYCLVAVFLFLCVGMAGAKGFDTPEAALQAYNDALRDGDFVAAYGILSPEDRAVISLDEFTARYAPRFGDGTIYRLQTEPEAAETLAAADEIMAERGDVPDYLDAAPAPVMPAEDMHKDAKVQSVYAGQMVAIAEKPVTTPRPSASQSSGSVAGSLVARELAPDRRADTTDTNDGVRVVNIITLRQEGDGWYVFHNLAAEAKLEELLSQALELARYDVMDNLLTARDMFAQAFAVEGFDALKDAYRQSYRHVLDRIGFLAVQDAYCGQLVVVVKDMELFKSSDSTYDCKYRISLHNKGDRQLRMLTFNAKLVSNENVVLYDDIRTIELADGEALPGSVWESDYLTLTGLPYEPAPFARLLVEVNRVYLLN